MGRLFWKIFFFIWLAQITAILGVGGAFWLRDITQNNLQQTLDNSPPASTHVELAAKTLRYEGLDALKALLERTHPALLVVDDHGFDLRGREVAPHLLAAARQSLTTESIHSTVRQAASPDGKTFLFFIARTEGNPSPPPLAFPHSKRPPPPQHPDNRFHPAIPLLTALVASLVFAILLAWYFSKPIRNLRTAFDALADGDMSVRAAPTMGSRRDELADLGRDFDQMAERLQNLITAQQRLLHDVSHEMRSPLARLQVAIGLLRQQPEKKETSIARIERESDRMDKLVGELLTLSRLEVGVEPRKPELVAIQQLITDVIEDANFEAKALGCHVQAGRHDQVSIQAEPELLHRALENIVRNAIRHSPVGGCVTVETLVDTQQKTLTLAVQDQGEGVPESELRAIFEPFHRGANNSGADGHGLGLAIAQRVARNHGGSIYAINSKEGGLRVEIRLPLAR